MVWSGSEESIGPPRGGIPKKKQETSPPPPPAEPPAKSPPKPIPSPPSNRPPSNYDSYSTRHHSEPLEEEDEEYEEEEYWEEDEWYSEHPDREHWDEDAHQSAPLEDDLCWDEDATPAVPPPEEEDLYWAPKTAPKQEHQSAPKDNPKPAPRQDPNPAPKDIPKKEDKPIPRQEPKPILKREYKPAAKQDPKAVPKQDPKPVPRIDHPKPAPRQDPKPAPKQDPKPAPRSEPKQFFIREPTRTVRPEYTSAPRPDYKKPSGQEPKPAFKPDHKPDPKPAPKPAPKPWPPNLAFDISPSGSESDSMPRGAQNPARDRASEPSELPADPPKLKPSLKIQTDMHPPRPPPPPPAPHRPGPDTEKLINLLRTGNFADVTVIVGEGDERRTYQLHRNIICTKSEYFRGACGNLGTETARSSYAVLIRDLLPPIFDIVIAWVYGEDIVLEHHQPLILALYRAADFLKINTLKIKIAKQVSRMLKHKRKHGASIHFEPFEVVRGLFQYANPEADFISLRQCTDEIALDSNIPARMISADMPVSEKPTDWTAKFWMSLAVSYQKALHAIVCSECRASISTRTQTGLDRKCCHCDSDGEVSPGTTRPPRSHRTRRRPPVPPPAPSPPRERPDHQTKGRTDRRSRR
ncbi:hypothetical protein TWF730_003634 [Orbilia blumenaviensis]|uniref:BTB domain-containing protein n=1 Tax=Orbilia blumenaviensis TaxID=1796055 RepID=A0AAV9U766_9PEZI